MPIDRLVAQPDENSIWWLEGRHGLDPRERDGHKLTTGQIARIYHPASDQYLHSHPDQSPCSVPGNVQREVSVSSQNNLQDNWTVTARTTMKMGGHLIFEHSDGNQFLHSHDRVFLVDGRASCLEVTCCGVSNYDNIWLLEPAESQCLELPPVSDNQGLVIYWASYGRDKAYHNVTAILRSEIRNGTLSIIANIDMVGGHNVGDPSSGNPKILSAHYSFRGVRMHRTAQEGHPLNLP